MDPLREAFGQKFDELEIVEADLENAESIHNAIEGCDYVVHTASPFPSKVPKNEDQIIKPAVNGTKAVVEACHKFKVKRVVITSSVIAIFDPIKAKT